MKDINSIKSWVCDLGMGGEAVMVSNRVYSRVVTLAFWCHSELVAW
jgi:hypothetical protein